MQKSKNMVYNRLFLNVIIRVILLTINAVGLGLALVYLTTDDFVTICTIAILLITQSIFFVFSFNRINRDLLSFFVSVKSADSTVIFKTSGREKHLKQLYTNFNRVQEILKNLRLDYETQNQYFKTVTNHTATGLISFRKDGKTEIFNNAAMELLNTGNLSNIRQLNHIDKNLPDTLFNLKPSEQKLFRLKINNEILALTLKATELKIDGKWIKLVSLQNIKYELVENEIEAWQKLFRVLTHEIMNSVGPISSTVTTMSDKLKYREEPKDDKSIRLSENIYEKTIRGLDIIGERSEGLLDFVDNFRKFTLFPTPVINEIRISELFNNIHDLLEEKLKPDNIEMLIDIADVSLSVYADKGLIEQVMINLINNSIAFLRNTENKMIKLFANTGSDNRIILKVIDNGSGITDDNIEQVFVPFFTTRDDGSGIGLSLSRQIMRLHGGTISVSSEPDVETVFTLKF